jgi:hypothetical protein
MAKAEAKTEVKLAAPKGTQKSEVILGTASVKLGTGVKALEEMVVTISKLPEQIADNLLVISDQENKIAEQSLELKNSIAQNKIELAQAYERDRATYVSSWLQENKKVAIDQDELEELKEELNQAERATDAAVKKEAAIVANSLTTKHNAELREKALEFTAKEAQNVAALTQKDDKIKFLEEQCAAWKKALENEQEAGIKRAQAGAIQQTIQTGK